MKPTAPEPQATASRSISGCKERRKCTARFIWAARLEDGPLVVAKDSEPGLQPGCVIRSWLELQRYAKISTEEELPSSASSSSRARSVLSMADPVRPGRCQGV